MLTEIRIRAMSAGDLDRVLEIAAGLVMAPRWSRLVYAKAISTENRLALVVEVSGLVVGFAVAGILAPEAELESIAVAAEWQGQGVGLALLQALVERLKLLRATEMMLEVRASNEAALGFYLRLGFVEVGRRRGYYSGPVEDAVLLRLGLSTPLIL